MEERVYISNRTRNLIVISLAMMYLAICAYAITTTREWIGRPFPGFLVSKYNTVTPILMSSWSGPLNGIENRDRIIAINGRPVKNSDEFDKIILEVEPRSLLTFSIIRDGEKIEKTVPISVFTLKDYLLLFPGLMLFEMILILTGLVVFYLKPNSPSSWFFLTLGVGIGVSGASVSEFCTNHTLVISTLSYQLVGPAVFAISLFFPVERKLRKPLAGMIIFITLSIISILAFAVITGDGHLYLKTFRYSILYSYGSRAAGIVIMFHSFIKSTDPLVRQQGKVVSFGFGAGFLILMAIMVNILYFKRMNFLYTIIPWIIIPLSVGYAIVKHNLFDVDVFIRKTVSYLVVSGIIIGALFLMISLLSLGLQSFTGQSSQIAAIISTLMMVVVFAPLRALVDRTIDRRFFREKYEYTDTIRKASAVLVSIFELNKLLPRLLDTVLDSIKIERGCIHLPDPDLDKYLIAEIRGYGPKTLPPSPWDKTFPSCGISRTGKRQYRLTTSGASTNSTRSGKCP